MLLASGHGGAVMSSKKPLHIKIVSCQPNHYHMIPELTLDSIKRYIESGIPTGSFLEAVLCNDLAAAVARADQWNLSALPAIVGYLYSECPRECWGSLETVNAWIAMHRAQR